MLRGLWTDGFSIAAALTEVHSALCIQCYNQVSHQGSSDSGAFKDSRDRRQFELPLGKKA